MHFVESLWTSQSCVPKSRELSEALDMARKSLFLEWRIIQSFSSLLYLRGNMSQLYCRYKRLIQKLCLCAVDEDDLMYMLLHPLNPIEDWVFKILYFLSEIEIACITSSIFLHYLWQIVYSGRPASRATYLRCNMSCNLAIQPQNQPKPFGQH